MGSAKPAMPFGGSTFLERVLDAARPVFDKVAVIGREEEPPHDDVAPIFGVAAALADLGAGRGFVLAVDYPLITSELLRFLSSRAESSPAPVVAPEWNGRVQTLCAVYDASLAPRVAARIAERRYDLRGLIAEAGGEIIAESDIRGRFPGEPLMNVNTPEQLEAARRLL
jgi:molybdopterin-guanine dinucleotide biosynthesis protein A